MTSQARFLGWKIWSMQAASLVVVYFLIYTVCAGDISYLWGRHLPVLLCFGSVLLLFPTLPILARSRRYQMAETEQVSRFSSNRLLIARLVMIGAGDFLMLTLLFFLFNLLPQIVLPIFYPPPPPPTPPARGIIPAGAVSHTGEYLYNHCRACADQIRAHNLPCHRDGSCGDPFADVLFLLRFL